MKLKDHETLSKDKVWEMRQAGLTLQQIGDIVGVTRERVRQILQKNFGTTRVRSLPCEWEAAKILGCAYSTLRDVRERGLLHPIRVGLFIRYSEEELKKADSILKKKCAHCGHIFLGNGKYCPDCRWVMFPCAFCGKQVRRRRTLWVHQQKKGQKLIFCDRVCVGSHAGRYFGFAVSRSTAAKEMQK